MSGVDFDRDPAIGYAFGVSAVGVNSVMGNLSGALSFFGGNPDAKFQSISGIRAEREPEEYRPLGANNFS